MNIYQRAIEKWGAEAQIDMIVEECAELIHALQKLKRDKSPDQYLCVIEEVADVEIMCEQARYLFSTDLISNRKSDKLNRLEKRLNEAEYKEE